MPDSKVSKLGSGHLSHINSILCYNFITSIECSELAASLDHEDTTGIER